MEKKSTIRQGTAENVAATPVPSADDSTRSMFQNVTEKYVQIVSRIMTSMTNKGSPPSLDKYFKDEEIGRLVLTLKKDHESVNIGGLIQVDIVEVKGKQVRVGIIAPRCIQVGRFKVTTPWRYKDER